MSDPAPPTPSMQETLTQYGLVQFNLKALNAESARLEAILAEFSCRQAAPPTPPTPPATPAAEPAAELTTVGDLADAINSAAVPS